MAITNKPQTIKHNNRSNNRDFNIFTEEYFGGSDAFIYTSDKREHQIAHIQFSIQEQQKPIYGYGSRTFDDIAVGNRIVIGAFKIPIQNTDDSNFDDDWGNEIILPVSYTASAPNWVYNYQPKKEKSNLVTNQNEKNNEFSTIAKIQQALGLEVNGFMDEKTILAINKYRKNNEMMLGTTIDNELLTALKIRDYSCVSIKDSFIYDSPTKDKIICNIQKGEKLIFIAKGDQMVLVRNRDNKSGFVNIEDVHLL